MILRSLRPPASTPDMHFISPIRLTRKCGVIPVPVKGGLVCAEVDPIVITRIAVGDPELEAAWTAPAANLAVK